MSEVLQAVESTIRLYNSFNEPLAWEIAKCEPLLMRREYAHIVRARYWPPLESWDPATVRFETRGARKGVLQPRTS